MCVCVCAGCRRRPPRFRHLCAAFVVQCLKVSMFSSAVLSACVRTMALASRRMRSQWLSSCCSQSPSASRTTSYRSGLGPRCRGGSAWAACFQSGHSSLGWPALWARGAGGECRDLVQGLCQTGSLSVACAPPVGLASSPAFGRTLSSCRCLVALAHGAYARGLGLAGMLVLRGLFCVSAGVVWLCLLVYAHLAGRVFSIGALRLLALVSGLCGESVACSATFIAARGAVACMLFQAAACS